MGQILHAKTTHAVRAAIQRSKASIKELASRYDLNPKTVMKWRKRAFLYDAPMGPKVPRSTVLSAEEEALLLRSASIRCCRSTIAFMPSKRPSRISRDRRCIEISRLSAIEGETGRVRGALTKPGP
jgi:transposase-like protein